jgi:hypothetical protein
MKLTAVDIAEYCLIIVLLKMVIFGIDKIDMQMLWILIALYGIAVLKLKQFGGMIVGGGFNITCNHPQIQQPPQPQPQPPTAEREKNKEPIQLRYVHPVEGDSNGEEK